MNAKAGPKRYRVTIQERSGETGTRGQSTEDWQEKDRRWANVVELTGRELEQARQVIATATTRLEMRKPQMYELTTEHRVLFGGANYGIGAIVPSGDGFQDVLVLCSRVVA